MIKMELLANKQPLSSSATLRKQDLINYFGNRSKGNSMIELAMPPEQATDRERHEYRETQTSSQPESGLPACQTPPVLSRSTTTCGIQENKTGSTRNKKHRKKKRAAVYTAVSDELNTKSPTCNPLRGTEEDHQSIKSPNKTKGKIIKGKTSKPKGDNSDHTSAVSSSTTAHAKGSNHCQSQCATKRATENGT